MIEKEIPYEVVTGKLNVTASTINDLTKLGFIEVDIRTELRNPIYDTGKSGSDVKLNYEQKKVVEAILEDYHKSTGVPHLIHGVTGSGQTEVYIELIAAAAAEGKASIMLIPEIALTYQTVMRFYNRFKDRVSFLNSRMSAGERYDQYLRAREKQIDVIIGPRSALFTPFPDLGFIIIDEEHESTYRSENVPKYDARGVAKELARLSDATLVLGSATPSVESYYQAKKAKYRLHEMPNRVGNRPMANVTVVDMREELKTGNRSVLSGVLREAIEKRLQKKEQTMLFINRRGIAGFVSCRACGYVLKCPHCDVSLSIHKGDRLVCHYCGYETKMVRQCPVCGSYAIKGFKAGTQMMEDIISRDFPKAKVLRMDSDTTKNKDGHEKILSAFANQQADILVGTQMIVKGHDFPNVTLVGALAADMSLNAPDYRGAERTFQLLTQAAGRAGRGDVPGEVVIQTYSPEHYSIAMAAAQDFNSFYEKEITYRKSLGYPPVAHMANVLITSKNNARNSMCALELKKFMAGFENDNLAVIGPSDLPIARINDIYRKGIYLKSPDRNALVTVKDAVEEYLKENREFLGVNVQFELD